MDFSRKSRHRKEIKLDDENLEQVYPNNVMLYRLPPIQDITIQEFEELALERLKVLRIFNQASSKNLRVLSDEWKESIITELNREGLKSYVKLIQNSGTKKESDFQARRRDYISHFILRLAYCRSVDLKRWFLIHEMELFKFKFSSLTQSEIKHFLELNKMDYTPLTDEEKNEIKDGLYESTMNLSNTRIELLDFYQVNFTEVPDLIRGRKCFLKNGYAYVSTLDFISIVAERQSHEIENGLQAAQKLLPEIENDERIFYLLKGLHTSYTGKDYTLSKTGAVQIECLDQLSKKSFPLCMRMCHETLRAKHHHKHYGRMQYGLFLKAIGVTLEDALRFWRDEFTKIMDLDRFEKSYAYTIRHNYGKEGSMINYTPFSCMKIITSSVGPQETHGCPFKIYDPVKLKMTLTNYGLSAAHVQDLLSFTNKGHYQIACGRYFEIIHETKLEQGINHPNQYFELSQTVMGNRDPQKLKNTQKNPRKSLKKEPADTTLMNVDDDDELWKIAETQESQTITDEKKIIEKNEWDEDFDVSHASIVDF